MGKGKNIKGKGITMGELRPHDPGKLQVQIVLPDQTSTMDADVLHHEYASPSADLKNYVPHGNLTTTPDRSNDTIRVLDLFYSKAINIITEHNLLAQDLDDAFGDNDMKLAVKIIDQRDIMLLQKLKLQKRIRLLESQLKVRKRTFKEQEYYDTISEVNKKYADRVKIRNAFMEKNDIEIVPASRTVISCSMQLENAWEEKARELANTYESLKKENGKLLSQNAKLNKEKEDLLARKSEDKERLTQLYQRCALSELELEKAQNLLFQEQESHKETKEKCKELRAEKSKLLESSEQSKAEMSELLECLEQEKNRNGKIERDLRNKVDEQHEDMDAINSDVPVPVVIHPRSSKKKKKRFKTRRKKKNKLNKQRKGKIMENKLFWNVVKEFWIINTRMRIIGKTKYMGQLRGSEKEKLNKANLDPGEEYMNPKMDFVTNLLQMVLCMVMV